MAGPWDDYQAGSAPGPWTDYQQSPASNEADALARGTGLGIRALAHGATGLFALPMNLGIGVGNLVNKGIGAIQGSPPNQYPSFSQQLDDFLTSIGVPSPRTTAERIASTALAAGTGGGSISAIASRGGPGLANPIERAVAEKLAESPGMATASGVTGGASQQVAAESGAGPVGQFMAGTLGSFLPAVSAPVSNLWNSVSQAATERGRQAIAGRVLQRFSSNPDAIAGLSDEPTSLGTRPDVSELTSTGATPDIGLAQLKRGLANNPDAARLLAQRDMENNAARVKAAQDIAGEPGKRDFYAADRQTVAQGLYQNAFDQIPESTPWIKGQITQLQSRPTFNKALSQASDLAADEGLKLDPNNVVQVLHYTNLALKRMAGSPSIGSEERAAILGIKDKLTLMMESKDFAPAYREARATYAEMSKPINQMDVGQAFADKLSPAINDFGGNTRMTANSFAQALRNRDAVAKQATGFRGATFENTLAPEQQQTLKQIAEELAARANSQELGATKGSPTASNFITQDILRGVIGPLGMPQSWAEAAIPQTLMRPLQWGAATFEQKVMQAVTNGILTPSEAQAALNAARQSAPMAGPGAGAFIAPSLTLGAIANQQGR